MFHACGDTERAPGSPSAYLRSAFWVEQATDLLRRATNSPAFLAASCRQRRAGSPFHPFFRLTCCWLTAWQAVAGADFTGFSIGASGNGSTLAVPGGFDVSGTGRDIGGASDEFHLGYQERSGDFDLRVRLEAVGISDPFVQAGLIARANLDPNAPFAGVFGSSAQLGCFFESRAAAGGQSQMASAPGGFPVNYPQTWLRLRRSGSQFTGFASLDGSAWQQVGVSTIDLPPTVFFGLAVASHNTNSTTTARFRDLSPAANSSTFTQQLTREPLGPANRRTGLVFSEIMYHPAPRADDWNLEFVELYNAASIFVDLTGWRISGAVRFTFPDGFKLQAGEFVVIAANPAAVESVYGLRGVLGPFAGRLNNASERLRLLNPAGAVRLAVEYSPNPPWPVAADGAGHSLVLARPSFGENDPRAWAASDRAGGSPGEMDALWPNPWHGVVINEFLAHTDDPILDFIELFNASEAPVDLSDCILSDSTTTNKFRVPSGTVLPPRGFLSFDQNQLRFALNSAGETIYLVSADGTRVLDAIRFSGQENGVSSGRSADGAPTIRRLAAITPGAPNARRRVEDVVINEIMYHPISRESADEYMELHNRSASSVNLAGWRFTAGVDYRFPPGAVIPPAGYVVVAKDVERLRAKHSHLTPANSFGNFDGVLSDSGERVALAKPDSVLVTNRFGVLITNTIQIEVSEVTYAEGGRWPELADGGGSSLELIDPRSDSLRASNWAASDESQKAAWTPVEFTGPLDLGNGSVPANRLQIIMLGAGECLIDDVECFAVGSTNLLANGGFENGTTGWSFFGHHSRSTLETVGAFSGQRCLHVRAPGDGDTANNAIRAVLSSTLRSGQRVTLRAQVRWLAGWPEVLFRVRGNWIEVPVRMELPKALGTPGLPNSRQVPNAGPAIFDVTHSPALPQANQRVLVTCRISDPDGVSAPRLMFRADPATTLTTLTMRDDGAGGDAFAADGMYTATVPGRPGSSLVAFRIEAVDEGSPAASALFPIDAPQRECLIRWGDPNPFGTFAHYHLWSTAATEQARSRSRPLDNTYRDCTLVYNNSRVIYNAGYRDKGSPYHGGAGDYAATVPRDDLLLGADERVFGSTGNGGNEGTGMRGDVSAWVGSQMGIPYLHSHFIRLYRNGAIFRSILYDLEQPNRDYARSWFGGNDATDDLYKVSVWFEFQDDNNSFAATGATLERFLSGGTFKLGRYRWNWQQRPGTDTANNYTNIFNLAAAANNTADRVTRLMNLADMEQWMRIFAFNRVLGNWDAWTFNVGQNMFLYQPTGRRAVLMPWDIDFVLGDGNGVTDALWGGQDPVMNQIYSLPVYRRMLWRAYQDAVKGPMLPGNYNPQIDARRAALLKNSVTGLSDPRPLKTYLDGRRNYLIRQLQLADTPTFAITTSGGADFTTGNAVIPLAGRAPFAVASIEINGIPYPANWTTFTNWQMNVPLGAALNELNFVGRDLRGNAVSNATARVTIRYTGEVPQPRDWLVLNEIMYQPSADDAEFIELHNRHPSVSFNLSGFRLNGAGYTFPAGTFIAPSGFVVLVKDRAAFARTYGATIPVTGEYSATLDNGGETLSLIQPGTTEADDIIIDDVRYDDDPPWPAAAKGLGASLQLIDPAQDNWRVGNWAAAATNSAVRATPGLANATRGFLDPFPALWINEVLPSNSAGLADNQGEREPWVELYNTGTVPLDLSGINLSQNPNDFAQWSFPSGTALGAGQFLLVWADGEPGESTAAALHTNFRLNPTNGVVLLSRVQAGQLAAIDYIAYAVASPDRSVGSSPDGEPRKRRLLFAPTPGEANNPAAPRIPVRINEWMAGNRSILLDPADGDFEDWFELYNGGASAVDLTGYYLSVSLSNQTQFALPAGTSIPAGSFRVVWADGEVNQNAPGRDVHTSFRLPVEGGEIGLFGPDGSLVDGVTFGPQTADISQGSYPDGAEPPHVSFATPTPGKANSAQIANQPPVVQPIDEKVVTEGQALGFRVIASDPDAGQSLRFTLVNAPAGATINATTGDFSWIPTEAQGPAVYPITIRVTDTGTPARSSSRTFTARVNEANAPPRLEPIPDAVVDETSLLAFRAAATDPDLPPQNLTFSLVPASAPAGATIDPVTGDFSWTPEEEQGPGSYTITIRVTDNGPSALSATRTFTVTLREINNAPVINPVSPQSIDEGATLTLRVGARDPDNPPVKLAYTLENAPAGAAIDEESGLFNWTPTEAEGPRDYNVTVRVSEPGGSPSSTMSFLVGVREVNRAPVLAPIFDFAVSEGASLVFTNRASDADLPAQTLSFNSVNPLPKGAELDQATGVFSWPLLEDAPAGTHLITIRVSDDGSPPLSSEQTFRVAVNAPLRIAISEIQHRPAVPNAEYVEIANYSGTTAVNVGGWRLEGYVFVFPSALELEPGGFLCVARDLNAFRTAYGENLRVLGNATVSLPADGGLIRLIKPGAGGAPDEVVDEAFFSLRAPWPLASAAPGASLQVIDLREDNRRVGNWASSSGAVTNAPTAVISMEGSWRYWQNAAGPGSTWNVPEYGDTAWPSGAAILYVENAALPATKRTALTLGRTTYYFRARFNFSGNADGAQLRLRTILDDGAIFYLNGQEIHRLGMPSGAATQATFAARTVGDAVLEGPFDLPGTALRVGENVLAAEVHQINATSSDVVFGAALDLITVSAASQTPGAANSVAADLPSFPPVWINEVLPKNTGGLVDNAGDREPWIELFNAGEAPLRLDGWSLTDDYAALDRWTFPVGATIPARGFLFVWADGEPAESTLDQPHTNFRLRPNGGSVALARVQQGGRVVVDQADYAGAADDQSFGLLPDGSPFQRQKFPAPTPGASNRVAPSGLVLRAELQTGGKVRLSWNAKVGVRYRLEATSNLANPSWQSLFDGIADSSSPSFHDPLSDQQRYYRVRSE
ncbi:MAG: lamin tail domain-containing protein [Verrucomicrobia bacterium]|nr:lamin tail domain-containing protein [Verrucomicrobiota bacterium]